MQCWRHINYLSGDTTVSTVADKILTYSQHLKVQSTWGEVSNVEKSSSELWTTHQIKQKMEKKKKNKNPLSTSGKQLPNNTELSTATHKNNVKYPNAMTSLAVL